MKVTVRTWTGSVYVIEEREDGWWLSGENIATARSQPLGTRSWPILQPKPWPPVCGVSLVMVSRHFEEPDHPDRIPGGGKCTTPVQSIVTEVQDAASR